MTLMTKEKANYFASVNNEIMGRYLGVSECEAYQVRPLENAVVEAWYLVVVDPDGSEFPVEI